MAFWSEHEQGSAPNEVEEKRFESSKQRDVSCPEKAGAICQQGHIEEKLPLNLASQFIVFGPEKIRVGNNRVRFGNNFKDAFRSYPTTSGGPWSART